MPYDPRRHHRRSIRLKGYDYTRAGAYFITIVTQGRVCLFGEVVDGEMRLNDAGEIVRRCWLDIPVHFPHTALDEFVVMPNHMHGIVWIVGDYADDDNDNDNVGAQHAVPLQIAVSPHDAAPPHDAVPPHGAATLHDAMPPRTERFGKPVAGSIPTIIRSFKSAVTKYINQQRGTPGAPVWQRNYYERIIRDERALDCIRRYIAENPLRWHLDRENTNRIGGDDEVPF